MEGVSAKEFRECLQLFFTEETLFRRLFFFYGGSIGSFVFIVKCMLPISRFTTNFLAVFLQVSYFSTVITPRTISLLSVFNGMI